MFTEICYFLVIKKYIADQKNNIFLVDLIFQSSGLLFKFIFYTRSILGSYDSDFRLL